jgi:hypothetical protein
VSAILLAAAAGALVVPAAALAEEGRITSQSTALVRPSADFSSDPRSARASFRAFDFDGTWQVESKVVHPRLVCATYQVGLRFGVGNPGCTDVRWLSDVSYVTRERQCNQAEVVHSGGQTEPRLGAALRNITCAERVVRCTGNCN